MKPSLRSEFFARSFPEVVRYFLHGSRPDIASGSDDESVSDSDGHIGPKENGFVNFAYSLTLTLSRIFI